MIAVIAILALIGNLAADPITPSYEALSLKEAKTLLDTVEGDKPLQDFVAAAVRSRRMDLCQLSFRHRYTLFKLRDEVAALPDSTYKDELVVMMLKSDSPFWPVDEPLLRGAPFELGGLMKEPFISAIKKNLPGVALDESLLDNRAARLKLAAYLEIAIAKSVPKVPPETPKNTMPSPSPAVAALRGGPGPTPALKANPPISQTINDPKTIKPWIIGLGVLAFIVGVIFKRRRRSNVEQ